MRADMTMIRRSVFLVAAMSVAASAVAGEDEVRLTESRALVEQFAAELQSALKSAMVSGGPVAAISVCRDQAPEIASRLSRQSGAAVGRVSARHRNPLNAARGEQIAVLAEFETVMADEPGSVPEHFALDASGRATYLKAIPTAALCLTCHGETLAEPVVSRLAADYPHDLATGYRPGELRGAFSVLWPASPVD